MKTIIACFLFVACLTSLPPLHAQSSRAPKIQWQATLGGEKADWTGSVIETDDGNILVEGVATSPPGGNKTSPLLDSHYWPANSGDFYYAYGGDVWVVKLDKAGKKMWDRSFGTPGDDNGWGMALAADGGIWISGRGFNGEIIPLPPGTGPRTNSAWFVGTWDNFLARMDSDGQASWQFFPGGGGVESLFELLPSVDNGMLVIGSSASQPGAGKQSPHYGDYDGWVVKVGVDGVQQADWSFGGSARDSFFDAKRTSDGGIILVGDSYSQNDGTRTVTNFGYSDLWVLRLNASGDVLWEKGLGGTGVEEVAGGGIVSETPDGGFIIYGRSDSPPSGNKTSPLLAPYDEDFDLGYLADIWIIKLNRDGEVEWNTSAGTLHPDLPLSAQATVDGGVLLSGSAPVYFVWPPVQTQFFTKISPSGTQTWQLEFTRPEDGVFKFATSLPMPDGGALLALPSSCVPTDGSFGSPQYFGAEDIWLIRVDANGRRLWDMTLGGNGAEFLSSLTRARDGGFIVAMSSGTALDGANGNKTHRGYGGLDMWIVKLSPELPPDSDGDGIADNLDQCLNTPRGTVVNSTGCSIKQLIPCDGPWKNHGQYVNQMAKVCAQFRKAGLLSYKQSLRIFLDAAKSDCGKRRAGKLLLKGDKR